MASLCEHALEHFLLCGVQRLIRSHADQLGLKVYMNHIIAYCSINRSEIDTINRVWTVNTCRRGRTVQEQCRFGAHIASATRRRDGMCENMQLLLVTAVVILELPKKK